jgi:nucleotidyltransferase substrate binding protein (TIGR01987 family)
MSHNLPDIRWIQRFQNYQRSFLLLQTALEIKQPSQVEQAGIIQFFEMTFELAWKLLKDYLDEEGYSTKSPRESIKQAFQIELISNGQQWLYALNDRNLTVHTYDENTALAIENKIRSDYFPLLEQLYNQSKIKINKLGE